MQRHICVIFISNCIIFDNKNYLCLLLLSQSFKFTFLVIPYLHVYCATTDGKVSCNPYPLWKFDSNWSQNSFSCIDKSMYCKEAILTPSVTTLPMMRVVLVYAMLFWTVYTYNSTQLDSRRNCKALKCMRILRKWHRLCVYGQSISTKA